MDAPRLTRFGLSHFNRSSRLTDWAMVVVPTNAPMIETVVLNSSTESRFMANSPERAITVLLADYRKRKPEAEAKLFPLVYEQLKLLAQRRMTRERANHTLRPTELVNEAYLRLFQNEQVGWQNRAHFFAIAASQMRRILIEQGRKQSAGKRQGIHLELKEADAKSGVAQHLFGDVEALLEKLQASDPAAARVVELKIFAGFTDDEIAQLAGVTRSKVRADWGFAKAWLATRLGGAKEKI